MAEDSMIGPQESHPESGFALPSVLLLITVLSLLAASVLTLSYFLRAQAFTHIARVKAEYAAESGIAFALDEYRKIESPEDASSVYEKAFTFNEDGSSAKVKIDPWGAYLVVRSVGTYRKREATRTAIVGERFSKLFDNALVFGNPDHQLIFTGTSSIKGDVIVGPSGTTVGTLKDHQSPLKVPVEGEIRREKNPRVPEIHGWLREVSKGEYFFKETGQADDQVLWPPQNPQGGETFIRGTIPDSIQAVTIASDAIIADTIIRTSQILRLNIEGRLRIARTALIEGLVEIVARNTLTIEKGARITQAVFYSLDSIYVSPQETASVQLIAPKVEIGENVMLTYPSVALSCPLEPRDSTGTSLVLSAGATVQGFVGLWSPVDLQGSNDLANIEANACVIGVLYSNTRMSFEGRVEGVVLTKDFYFYEPPTTYLGWLKGGTIVRDLLPKGCLLPVGLTQDRRLDILEWL